MHLRIKTSIALIVLTILDLCLSVPNLADQTIINNNGNSMFSNNNYKLTTNNKQFLNNNNDDHSDKSGTNLFPRNGDDRFALKSINEAAAAAAAADNSQSTTSDSDHPNFLITNYLSDGEIERRIQFNGITAKETFVPNSRYGFYFLHLINCVSI